MKKSIDPTKIEPKKVRERAATGAEKVSRAAKFKELKNQPAPILGWSNKKV